MKKIALIGTTASGKTALAHRLALNTNSIILSLDSLCVYKELNIINAKPSKKKLREIKYFGIDLISIKDDFNVALFFEEYQKALNYAKNNSKNLIICGGTSFYLKAMLDGLSPKIPEIKHNLNIKDIYELALSVEKNFKITQNDKYRLNKWYNIYLYTNEIPSIWLEQNTTKGIIEDIKIYDLLWDKESLNQRIISRTNEMLENKAIDEVINLYQKYGNVKALNSIGAKEIIEYHEDKLNEDLSETISIHTRQLAKRQRTFNKKFNATIFNIKEQSDLDKVYEEIRQYLVFI